GAEQKVDVLAARLVPNATALALPQHDLGRQIAERTARQYALGGGDDLGFGPSLGRCGGDVIHGRLPCNRAMLACNARAGQRRATAPSGRVLPAGRGSRISRAWRRTAARCARIAPKRRRSAAPRPPASAWRPSPCAAARSRIP